MTPKKKLLIAVAVVAILLIGALLLRGGDDDRLRIEVIAIPEDSTITLNDGRIRAGRVILEPGEHIFTASREHFSDATVKIHTDDIDPDEPVYLLPTPDTPEAMELLANNPGMQERREAAGGAIFAREQEIISEKYPMLADLPVSDQTFKIDYGASRQHPDNSMVIGIYVHAIDQPGRDDALNWMQTFGYDPDDYEIIYINPFEED